MKVLFFAPHSAIWAHAFPEALVAESLQQLGHEVVYVTCGEALQEQCVAMSALGLPALASLEQRAAACERCGANKVILRERMALRGPDLRDLLDSNAMQRIDGILAGVNRDNFQQLEIDSVPVGRYALYELILNRKKNDLALDVAEWLEYQAALRGALTALFAGKLLFDRERPDRLVTYNSLYSVNRVMWRLAELRRIPSYFLHAGSNLSRRLQTLWIGRDATFTYAKNLIAEWPRFRDRPCPRPLVETAAAHVRVLFRGESVFGYSAAAGAGPADVRSRFGIAGNQKIIVATMSSPDERFAAEVSDVLPRHEGLAFATQVEWIRAVVGFVADRPDLFLLIRVHPREFPNKREHVRSRNADLLAQEFSRLPANTAVNWPTDELALYDLANHAEMFLNSWSSAGKEMALLGLPVVVYSPELLFYPADLNYVGTTEAQYFKKIELALSRGWSLEHSRPVFRWLAVEHGYGTIDIADGYTGHENRASFAERAVRRLRRMLDADYVQKGDCARRPATLARQAQIEAVLRLAASTPLDSRVDIALPPSSIQEESAAICEALASIGETLFDSASADGRGPLARKLRALRVEARAA
jgi:hypothetical protein